MNLEITQIIKRGAAQLGIELPPGIGGLFETYCDILETRGKSVNLTAISGTQDIARFHFLDCLAVLKTADFKNARLIDIGSGAGFPGIPLKLAEPSIKLTLLDATGKRVAFLKDVCSELGIEANCFQGRAEDAAHNPAMREQFEIVTARAVAKLSALCELCLPFVRVGGAFLAMKGIDSDEELMEARNAIAVLGAQQEKSFDYTIPGTEISHRVIAIRKTTQTPAQYPRRFAKILKSSL